MQNWGSWELCDEDAHLSSYTKLLIRSLSLDKSFSWKQGISLIDGFIFVLYEATKMGYIRSNRKFKLCFAEHRFTMFFQVALLVLYQMLKENFLKTLS